MNKNVAGNILLDQIAQATGLTPAGKSNVINLINPLADFSVDRYGYAGRLDESPSVISAIKRSMVLVAPPGTVTTWDAHIFNTPVCTPLEMQRGIEFGNVLQYDALSQPLRFVGPFTVISAPAGHALSIQNSLNDAAVVCNGSSLSPDSNVVSSPSDYQSAYMGGISSINAMGFEVHDTTAEISKQGSLCVYALPQSKVFDRVTDTIDFVDTIAAPTTHELRGSISTAPLNDVPGTLADCMLLAGSQQWEAKFGAYVVPTLNSEEIPVQKLESVLPVFHSGNYTSPAAYPLRTQENVAQPTAFSRVSDTTVVGAAANLYSGTKLNCFNTAGIFIQGLAPTASLVINSVMYVERFPTPQEQALVVLASKSPRFDPLIPILVSGIMQMMPKGTKVANNADGDWFFEGVSTLANWLKPAIKAMAGPFATPGVALANAADDWAKGKLKERNKKAKEGPAKVPPTSSWETGGSFTKANQRSLKLQPARAQAPAKRKRPQGKPKPKNK
jgi:hypothetical protein